MPATSKEPITAEMLKYYMGESDIDVNKLSRILGVDPSSIRRWTNEKSKVHPSGTAEMILRALMLRKYASDFMVLLTLMGTSGLSLIKPLASQWMTIDQIQAVETMSSVSNVSDKITGEVAEKVFFQQMKNADSLRSTYELYTELKKVFEPLEENLKGIQKPQK